MGIIHLERHFKRMGAELVIAYPKRPEPRWWQPPAGAYALDIVTTRRKEHYKLDIFDREKELEFIPLEVRPDKRHLLLLVREDGEKEKFLCGHDERHWFAATLPARNGIVNIRTAMESLKPREVIASQLRNKVSGSQWNKRHNAGFVRQGEWFFLPERGFQPAMRQAVLSWEPIRRGGGKPHMVEYLYRTGGESVRVCPKFPNGVTEVEYKAIVNRNPRAARWNWQLMRRNPGVYAKGQVRHPDHNTLKLHSWHRVVMAAEPESRNLAFLD